MAEKKRVFIREQELQFSGEQGFFDKSNTLRFLIIGILALALFAFLHFREVQVEIPELNSIAPGYIVSQVDFDFPDDEATIILRQDALRDVSKIYQLSQKDIRKSGSNLRIFFSIIRAGMNRLTMPPFNPFTRELISWRRP